MTTKKSAGPNFDRIKPAVHTEATQAPVIDARDDDVQGKRALFSGAEQPPALGSVALECGRCSRRSIVSYVRLAKMMTTGFYIPVLSQKIYAKCPNCKKHSWLEVTR